MDDIKAIKTDERRGPSGMTLKWIATVTMVIDHVAASLLARYLTSTGRMVMLDVGAMLKGFADPDIRLSSIYLLMRLIGRTAFPIYAFLLVEGFIHTRSVWKYMRNLAIFAVVSEVPFDMAWGKSLIDTSDQNVFFTLLMGVIALTGVRWLTTGSIRKKTVTEPAADAAADGVAVPAGGLLSVPRPVRMVLSCVWVVLIGAAAEWLNTDYGLIGIATIVVIYIARSRGRDSVAGLFGIITLCIATPLELASIWTAIPMARYSGRRGRGPKYLFYAIYPAHLLILGLVCRLMGI